MAKAKVTQAVASMTSHGVLGPDRNQNARIMEAMVEAVKQCQADGITDNAAIRQAQLDARDRVIAG